MSDTPTPRTIVADHKGRAELALESMRLERELTVALTELARLRGICNEMPVAEADKPPQPHFTEYPPL